MSTAALFTITKIGNHLNIYLPEGGNAKQFMTYQCRPTIRENEVVQRHIAE